MAERSQGRKPPADDALEAFYRAVGELLLKASERRAKMAAGDRPKQGGQAA